MKTKQELLDTLNKLYGNSPVDFLGTGSDAEGAAREEHKWQKDFTECISYVEKLIWGDNFKDNPAFSFTATAEYLPINNTYVGWVKTFPGIIVQADTEAELRKELITSVRVKLSFDLNYSMDLIKEDDITLTLVVLNDLPPGTNPSGNTGPQ